MFSTEAVGFEPTSLATGGFQNRPLSNSDGFQVSISAKWSTWESNSAHSVISRMGTTNRDDPFQFFCLFRCFEWLRKKPGVANNTGL